MRHVLHLMQPDRPGGRGGEGGPTGPCAFPATNGSADLRLPPPRSAIIALHQFRFFGRNAQNADIPRRRGDVPNRPSQPWSKGFGFETRKLAAILAVDIVGFSRLRLTGADEDHTLASQPRATRAPDGSQ
jgi:hypothetical protein